MKPTYKPQWELPGGAVEDGESPGAAATREIADELGIVRRAATLLAVDYVPASGSRTEGVVVVFDGGTIADASVLRLPAVELSDSKFVAPGELDQFLPGLQSRRAVSALRARDSGCAVYLEDGRPG